jgi:[ribosomal protein S18]-alanine N-acetyltransferase
MDVPLRILPIRLKDLDRILEIERASFGADAYDRELFLEYRAGGALFMAAVSGGRILGYALAEVRGRRAELVSIAVDPPFRGRGAASALIESLLGRLRRRRVLRMSLMVKTENGDAQALYLKYGFRRVRRVRRYYEDGADGLLMTRERRPESGAPAPIALP